MWNSFFVSCFIIMFWFIFRKIFRMYCKGHIRARLTILINIFLPDSILLPLVANSKSGSFCTQKGGYCKYEEAKDLVFWFSSTWKILDRIGFEGSSCSALRPPEFLAFIFPIVIVPWSPAMKRSCFISKFVTIIIICSHKSNNDPRIMQQ